ncbi:hypothetical protein JCM19232_4213 [Vibrio ishigakensis]|uniref:Uncharacterized protein n=1 Tax=Vibrio ishigakensis TaxID=1481914 RepID=A0A0B8PQ43_9VIBR|nr:hypothetical protein JCM19232_4213 [Vibrio ishigakensis]
MHGSLTTVCTQNVWITTFVWYLAWLEEMGLKFNESQLFINDGFDG